MRTRFALPLAALILSGPALAQTKAVVAPKTEVKISNAAVKILPNIATPAKAAPAAVPAPIAAPALADPTKAEPKTESKADPVKADPTPVVPVVDPDDVGAIVTALIASAKDGKWALLVGFIVMLLT